VLPSCGILISPEGIIENTQQLLIFSAGLRRTALSRLLR
jgi:hypothetical protein